MSSLDDKINEHFAGYVVRKDLVKAVKGNAIVPTYVLEYLLGQYCATDDEASIQSGIETVKEILRKHYVHRNEAGLIQSTSDRTADEVYFRCACANRAIAFGNPGIKKVNIRRTFGLSRCVRGQVLMIFDPDATLQTQKRFPCLRQYLLSIKNSKWHPPHGVQTSMHHASYRGDQTQCVRPQIQRGWKLVFQMYGTG